MLKICCVLCITGVALTGGPESTGYGDVSQHNRIRDYSYINTRGKGLLFRCVSGLGPASSDNIDLLKSFSFNGTAINGGECGGGHTIRQEGAPISSYVGIINVYLCETFTTRYEGVYTCTMKNSREDYESVRVGIYFSNRSKFINLLMLQSL